VLVDGAASYAAFRELNSGIEKQNSAVLGQSPDDPSALLAVRKWLELQRKASRAQKIMSLSYVAVCDGRQ
jgi:peroxiredoxin